MNLRVLIVDDERPARDLIATLLRSEPGVEIVGQSPNGRAAVEDIGRLAPDLIFLDVQMPGLDGFEVLARLPEHGRPLVVFVTAHDQHAVRAFEVHALDYLLKPFEYDRLRQAVRRAREQLTAGELAAQQGRISALLAEVQKRAGSWDRIALRDNERTLFVRPGEIDWIEAEGNYLRVHLGARSFLLRETMHRAEARLAGKRFVRINRSTLLNLERIKEWQPLFHGDSVVILDNGTRLAVSRLYREKLDNLVEQLG